MWNIEHPCFLDSPNLPNCFNVVDFTPSTLKAFGKFLADIYSKSFPYAILNIDSHGGDVGVMCGFMSLMEDFRKKGIIFVGVVSGFAFSAGCAIFLYCDNDYRFMGNTAHIMIHNSQGEHSYSRISAIHKYSEFYKNHDERINEKISLHLKKPKNWLSTELKNRCNDDWMLNSDDAAKLKLCSVGLPTFNLKISSEFSISF